MFRLSFAKDSATRYFVYFGLFYLFLLATLLFFKLKPYEFHLSSLIGIWEGFQKINPTYIEKDTVIYRDGGYDGQFFFFLAKYISSQFFGGEKLPFPILDSFFFRFHRITVPLLSGISCSIAGFKNYSLITLSILIFFHLYSSHKFLRFLLKEKYQETILSQKESIDPKFSSEKLSLKNRKFQILLFCVYLFNPFALNSNLLLTSDSLVISLFTLWVLTPQKEKTAKFLFLILLLFSKETALFLLVPILWGFLRKREFHSATLLFSGILVYCIYRVLVLQLEVPNLGTNPIGFTNMVRIPFQGMLQSFLEGESRTFLFSNTLNLLYAFSVFLLSSWTILKKKKFHALAFANLLVLGVVAIADVGYFLSYDNFTRLVAITIPVSLFLVVEQDRGFPSKSEQHPVSTPHSDAEIHSDRVKTSFNLQKTFISFWSLLILVHFLAFLARTAFITQPKNYFLSF